MGLDAAMTVKGRLRASEGSETQKFSIPKPKKKKKKDRYVGFPSLLHEHGMIIMTVGQ